MNFEEPKMEIKKPLSKNEAHDEANMMNVKLAEEPDWYNKVKRVNGEQKWSPKAEDYDRALEVVEEVKKMVEEEPLTEKVLTNIARLAVKSSFGVAEVFAAMAGISGVSGPAEMIYQKKIKILENLDDASKKLSDLKAKGKEFGKRENE